MPRSEVLTAVLGGKCKGLVLAAALNLSQNRRMLKGENWIRPSLDRLVCAKLFTVCL